MSFSHVRTRATPIPAECNHSYTQVSDSTPGPLVRVAEHTGDLRGALFSYTEPGVLRGVRVGAEQVFEVGRRHKVMNPEKMRSEYGKLVYLLMDSQLPEIQELLEFKCVRPLQVCWPHYPSRRRQTCLALSAQPHSTVSRFRAQRCACRLAVNWALTAMSIARQFALPIGSLIWN